MKAKAPGLVTTLSYGVWRIHHAGRVAPVKVSVKPVGIYAEKAYGQSVLAAESVQVQSGQGGGDGGKRESQYIEMALTT